MKAGEAARVAGSVKFGSSRALAHRHFNDFNLVQLAQRGAAFGGGIDQNPSPALADLPPKFDRPPSLIGSDVHNYRIGFANKPGRSESFSAVPATAAAFANHAVHVRTR